MKGDATDIWETMIYFFGVLGLDGDSKLEIKEKINKLYVLCEPAFATIFDQYGPTEAQKKQLLIVIVNKTKTNPNFDPKLRVFH